ncbi:MAG: NAD(P)-dependent oxidoreductase [Candidatus Helarchaeota archaeon]|nr:NAD(P)-dependent oxidoreductase [Candidatus Helarchaeota archaeon]
MKVMVTGGLGGLGRHVSQALLEAGHDLLIFDVKTPRNEKFAEQFPPNCIHWGNITNPETFPDLSNFNAVIHLAFIIPPKSEERWARKINVGGTLNLVRKLEAANPSCRLVFSSSVSVLGLTQHLTPPITVDHPVRVSDFYTADKAICEIIVKESKLDWIILRFAESPYLEIELRPSYLNLMYSIPWNNRVEFVHPKDIAMACKNAIETNHSREIYIIGGGLACQTTFYEEVSQIFAIFKLPPPKKEKFNQAPYYLDWYDTTRSQQVLQFQARTLTDYLNDLKKNLGWKVGAIRFVAPIAKYFL